MASVLFSLHMVPTIFSKNKQAIQSKKNLFCLVSTICFFQRIKFNIIPATIKPLPTLATKGEQNIPNNNTIVLVTNHQSLNVKLEKKKLWEYYGSSYLCVFVTLREKR